MLPHIWEMIVRANLRRFLWREIYPHQRLYTWSSKDRSKQSRIDYWLISQSLANSCKSVSIHATPLTDHSAVSLKICLSASLDFSSSPSYWKLNNSLLLFEDVNKNITLLIEQYWRRALVLDSYCCQWELLKFEIGKYFRKFGSNLAKLKRAEENKVVSKIAILSSKPPELFSESEKLEYADLQSKLDEMYTYRAQGAYIRSRQKWMEEGECNTAYFFRLEKSRLSTSLIETLNIEGTVTNNPHSIAHFCSKFYSKLYKKSILKRQPVLFWSLLKIVRLFQEMTEIFVIVKLLYLKLVTQF